MKRKALSQGTKIGPYVVTCETGRDVFGISYFVSSTVEGASETQFHMREFFPDALAMRRFGKVYSANRHQKTAFIDARDACGELYEKIQGLKAEGLVSVCEHVEGHNTHYLVSEFPDGETFGEIVQAYGELTTEQLRSLYKSLLPGLMAYEERGLVHAGLSPNTLFRKEDGAAVVMVPTNPCRTGEKPVCAIPEEQSTACTPPELLQGAETGAAGVSADIYSLAALSFHLLTGKAPLGAPTRLAAMEKGEDDPFDWAALDAAVRDDPTLLKVLKLCLSLIPSERCQSYSEFEEAIIPPEPEVVVAPVAPVPTQQGESGGRWGRLAIAAAVLIGFVSLFFIFPRKPVSTPAEKPVVAASVEETDAPETPETSEPETGPQEDSVPVAAPADVPDGAEPVEDAEDTGGMTEVTPDEDFTPEPEFIEPVEDTAEIPAEDLTDDPVGFAAMDEAAWQKAVTEDSWLAYQAYLEQFGETSGQLGIYADEAALRLEARLGERAALIEETRKGLSALGYDVPDGDAMDGALSSAISTFQSEAGLAVDGDVSEELLSAIEAELETLSAPEETPASIQPAIPVGETVKDCVNCPSLVVLPAGRFMMGSPATEFGRNSAEDTPHNVEIENAFAIMPHEVTRGAFRIYLQETGTPVPQGCAVHAEDRAGYWATDRDANFEAPGFEQSDDHPVVCVSLEDAKAYADWLSAKTGETYRLPNSEEWEYAARAGTQTAYFWGAGAGDACSHANGGDVALTDATVPDWIVNICTDGSAFTTPVGSFTPNGADLYDMSGNVWEWVSDCEAEHEGRCRGYGLRGGSWASSPDQLRSAKRHSAPGTARYNTVGFRLIRELD